MNKNTESRIIEGYTEVLSISRELLDKEDRSEFLRCLRERAESLKRIEQETQSEDRDGPGSSNGKGLLDHFSGENRARLEGIVSKIRSLESSIIKKIESEKLQIREELSGLNDSSNAAKAYINHSRI